MTHIRARLGVNEGGRRSYYEEVINMTAIGIINLSLVGWRDSQVSPHVLHIPLKVCNSSRAARVSRVNIIDSSYFS